MELTKEKVKLIKQAQERFSEEIISPCGSRPSLWDSFELFDDKLTFWYNVGRNTHAEVYVLKEANEKI